MKVTYSLPEFSRVKTVPILLTLNYLCARQYIHFREDSEPPLRMGERQRDLERPVRMRALLPVYGFEVVSDLILADSTKTIH